MAGAIQVGDIKTAPADFRFPTANQTRHCFTRYIEFHKCLAAKGEDSGECEKFARYYRSLCPGNGLRNGMNRKKMERFQALFKMQVDHISFQTVTSSMQK